jgi:hypothetical protein
MYQQTTPIWSVVTIFGILLTLSILCICVFLRIQQSRKHKITCQADKRPIRGFRRPQELIIGRPSTVLMANARNSIVYDNGQLLVP